VRTTKTPSNAAYRSTTAWPGPVGEPAFPDLDLDQFGDRELVDHLADG
jgi:hypothetical protein